MSGYHYSDQSTGSCANCSAKSKYFQLKDSGKTNCGPTCLNRHNEERSEKDTFLYDFFVEGKSMDSLLRKKEGFIINNRRFGSKSKYGTL